MDLKDIEIRTQKTSFRGEFLIHTGKNIHREGHNIYPDIPLTPLGAIVGIAEIIGIVQYSYQSQWDRDYNRHKNPSEWFREGLYGYVIKDALPVKPIPYKGQLGFFNTNLGIDDLEFTE